MYDVFFLSYNEPYASGHFQHLKNHAPLARRLNGVKGIHAAHSRCAELSRTSHFFVMDADNEIVDPSVFDYEITEWDTAYVHLWYARNPVNDLEYGWGGLKLFPKAVFDGSEPALDMTTSFPLKIIPTVSSITHFNTTAYDTWRSAFREAVKLTLLTSEETQEWLRIWMTTGKGLFAEFSIAGAIDGHVYADEHRNDPEALMRINDYDWLHSAFDHRTGNVVSPNSNSEPTWNPSLSQK